MGCYLEIIDNRKLVWTGALGLGYRPQDNSRFPFSSTAIITLEPHGGGTNYVARVLHSDVAGRKKHEEMGFHAGWGKALDQLVAMAKEM